MPRLPSFVLPVLLLLAALPSGTIALPIPDGKEEEKILKDAGLAADPSSLLKFFRTRTPSTGDRARLTALMRDSGSRSFAVREKASRALTAAGETALPFLKAALQGSELEVRRRAENCIRDIERLPQTTLAGAAARLLALRRPNGAAEVLLAYLPFADWEALEDSLLETIAAVGLRGDAKKAAPLAVIVAAANDKDARRRAAAAYVLGRAGPDHRQPLVRLLADPEAAVRYQAAVSLLRCRESGGVAGLVALLDKGPPALVWRSEEVLGRLAGEQAPLPSASNDPAARKKWQAAWASWWQANERKLDLAKIKLDGGPSA